jgi:hypothetical protein
MNLRKFDVYINRLWIYLNYGIIFEKAWQTPKACSSSHFLILQVSGAGLKYDRAWCIIDVSGNRHANHAALNVANLPTLANIKVALLTSPDHARPILPPPLIFGMPSSLTLLSAIKYWYFRRRIKPTPHIALRWQGRVCWGCPQTLSSAFFGPRNGDIFVLNEVLRVCLSPC